MSYKVEMSYSYQSRTGLSGQRSQPVCNCQYAAIVLFSEFLLCFNCDVDSESAWVAVAVMGLARQLAAIAGG
ncbi:MAG: hypothetical protein HQK96_08730 [Nitrospirae bacterium]|nr:hypothetical protein [Nitrospirota bacterium]